MVQIKKYWTTASGEPELREFAEYVKGIMTAYADTRALEARIDERDHTWKLINDIRYQNITLDFAREVADERLVKLQVEADLRKAQDHQK